MSPTLLDVCKCDQRERRYLRDIRVLESIQRRASRLALIINTKEKWLMTIVVIVEMAVAT